jgi:hypothetical protein
MLSVRIRGQAYRVSNETLDRVLPQDWRRSSAVALQRRIQERLDEGKLVAQGRRLRGSTQVEEAEQRLRSAGGREEILRWGLFYVAAQIAEAAAEIRSLGELAGFDESVATRKLSRDTSDEEADLESKLRNHRAEPSEEFVERLAARVEAALERGIAHAVRD